jgi:pimeloyl-ACP methyl ester carboxylesterase
MQDSPLVQDIEPPGEQVDRPARPVGVPLTGEFGEPHCLTDESTPQVHEVRRHDQAQVPARVDAQVAVEVRRLGHGGRQRVRGRVPLPDLALDELAKQRFLVAEVGVDRLLGHSGAVGYAFDRRGVEPQFQEQIQRTIKDVAVLAARRTAGSSGGGVVGHVCLLSRRNVDDAVQSANLDADVQIRREVVPATSPTVRTGVLDVPGAAIHWEVRGAGPALALHAAPMDAAAFEPLANLLADDFTVVTSDPRGINRSAVADREATSTPEDRAGDLAALLDHLDLGRVSLFGSSGGAVSALALVQQRPDLVGTVIPHEPPLIELLDDRDEVRVAEHALVDLYREGDRRAYWRRFLKVAGIDLPPGVFEMIVDDERTEQQLRDERFGVEQMQVATVTWLPDLPALADSPVRIVPAVGAESAGQLCDRTTRALAGALGVAIVTMPGDHTGFAGDPTAFAQALTGLTAQT